jgi:hypothetical protein
LEAIGNVLEEDQAERDVLVVGRLHVAAQLVGGLEQFSLKAKVATIAGCPERPRAGGDGRRFLGFGFNRATKRDGTASTTPRGHDALGDEFILHCVVSGFVPLKGFAQTPVAGGATKLR